MLDDIRDTSPYVRTTFEQTSLLMDKSVIGAAWPEKI